MDTQLLVDDRIGDGQRLIVELTRSGFDVSVAFWVRTAEEGLWHLYIGSPSVDPMKIGDAYGILYGCLSRIPQSSVGMSEIKLVHPSNPLAQDAIALRDRHPGGIRAKLQGRRIGLLAIDEVYIYPRAKAFEWIVQGKEEVLRYLESDSQARAGAPGEYALARDESGGLVAFIAGHSFVGTGTVRLGDKQLVVVDGIVMEARDKPS